MTYTVTSSLTKTSGHYTAEQLWAAFKPMTPPSQYENAQRVFKALVPLCIAFDLDEVVLAAIIWIETGAAGSGLPFRSEWFVKYFNLGNIGITGDPAQNAAAQKWSTPEDGVFGLVAHAVAYAYGAKWANVWDTDQYGKPQAWDKRFALVLEEYDGKALNSLEALNGRWAWDVDNNYDGKLAERANKIVAAIVDQSPPVTTPSTPPEPVEGEPAMSNVFGRVPHPPYQRRIVANSTAWNDLGPRVIRAAVWHRMYGTLWGTDGYFRGEASGKALTDYGAGVAATDGAEQAGVILQWNDPTGRRSPWASGPVQNPTGDAVPFVDRYGVNGVNRDAVSIEISGNGNTPLDAKARAAVVALTAYYADQYRVPWDSFPAVPGEGRSFVMWHGEIYDGKRNSCPGAVVMAATDGMIAEVKALLKRYQTAGEPPAEPSEPVYAKPQPPAAGDTVVNGRYFMAHERTYTLVTDAVPRIYADPGSDPTGPKKQKGATVTSTHIVSDVGASADLTLVIDEPNGSRIPVSAVVS